MRFPVLLLVSACLCSAQPPTVVSVVNAASRDAGLSPGAAATLRYLSRLPFNPQTDEVRLDGAPVPVFDDETGETITIRIPVDVAPGTSVVTLSTQDGTS